MAIDVKRWWYVESCIWVQRPVGDDACRQRLASKEFKQRTIIVLVEPHAPRTWSNSVVPMRIKPQSSIWRTWRLFVFPPKMYCLFWNVTPQESYTSCPLVLKDVDSSPAVSISLGGLLSVWFLLWFFNEKPLYQNSKLNQFPGMYVDKNSIAMLIVATVVVTVWVVVDSDGHWYSGHGHPWGHPDWHGHVSR